MTLRAENISELAQGFVARNREALQGAGFAVPLHNSTSEVVKSEAKIPCISEKSNKHHAVRNQPERELQDQIIAYARLKGWKVAYFRPARVRRGGREVYETPVGADGKGFPDLVLIRERLVWIETKSDNGVLSEAQEQWWKWLLIAGQEYYVIRPSDWDRVVKILE